MQKDIDLFFDSTGALRVQYNGRTLPQNDQRIVEEIRSGQVKFSSVLRDDDPDRTNRTSHLNADGDEVEWPDNPPTYSFGLTGGTVPVRAECEGSGNSGSTVILIEIKPVTTKPFAG